MAQCTDVSDDHTLLAAPQLFGHLFNYGLFGILTAQVFSYYVAFPKDQLRLKVFVYTLYVIEVVQVALTTHDAFETLGRGLGDTATLENPQWLWFDIPIMSGIVSASVQIYFSWRIFVLSKSKMLCGFIVLLALMQGSAGIAAGVQAKFTGSLAILQESTTRPLVVWLGGALACDSLIAVSMIYYLSRGKQGLASDVMLAHLIRLTVETGCLTASVACMELVFFVAFRHNNLHLTPALVLTKTYTNSLLMLLNNRTQLRRMINGQVWSISEIDVEVSSHSVAQGSRRRSSAPPQFALTKFPIPEEEDCSNETVRACSPPETDTASSSGKKTKAI